jgi:hypothetical protein
MLEDQVHSPCTKQAAELAQQAALIACCECTEEIVEREVHAHTPRDAPDDCGTDTMKGAVTSECCLNGE